ncbi:hypothetical protein B0T13DRAFT_225620 [Neurospora crassa]|nr:hypothetical protein B0T13DRAFT_225620 [Neurospora crassa]
MDIKDLKQIFWPAGGISFLSLFSFFFLHIAQKGTTTGWDDFSRFQVSKVLATLGSSFFSFLFFFFLLFCIVFSSVDHHPPDIPTTFAVLFSCFLLLVS